MPINQLPKTYRSAVALLIGNGINRYGARSSVNSWNDLLVKLAAKHMGRTVGAIPMGVSTTEFYDLLELAASGGTTSGLLQEEFCSPMRSWIPDVHHESVVNWAIRTNSPILTTNFDSILSKAAKAKLLSIPGLPFTDFYPWDRYFGLAQLDRPNSGFGIWHVNGTTEYRRSIRLGLTHYMGSVERARTWLHKGNERRLFSGKDIDGWIGYNTWLHIVFNKPLLIFGLGLEENEVFLRWLLIERAKYFKAFPDRAQRGWFAYVADEPPGKLFFLRSVGIETIKLSSYDDLYGVAVWK